MSSDDVGDKTEVLTGNFETLNEELKKAKDQDSCLIVIRGNRQGHRFFLTQQEMTLGRDPSVDIVISDPTISKKHAIVNKQEGSVLLTDLGSANGTVVNGKALPKGTSINLGKEDVIRLGNTILKYVPAGEYEILFYSAMGDKAYTDALTGISNKRYLIEALEAEFKRAKALGSDLSILYLDIDHFKKINDTFGHDAGDYVLKEFCNAIRAKHIRPKDVFARYGGEEFVILLTNTGIQDASQIAENIRSAVEAHPFIYENKRIAVTSSFGVTELTSTIDSVNRLLKVADKALYESKTSGRNRVTVSS